MSTPLRAGWYPDPSNSGGERWWNGVGWSETRRSGPGATPTSATTSITPANWQTPTLNGTPTNLQQGFVAPNGRAQLMSAGSTALVTASRNSLAGAGFLISLIGFVFVNAFTLGIPGLIGGILSAIGVAQANRVAAAGSPATGRGLAVLGVILGFGGAILTWVLSGWVLIDAFTSDPG